MTRDDVIRMATEAGFGPAAGWTECVRSFERFAALVAAAEREVCARIAAEYGPSRPIATPRPSPTILGRWEGEQAASQGISAAIVARGQGHA